MRERPQDGRAPLLRRRVLNFERHRPKKTPRLMWAIGAFFFARRRVRFAPLDLFANVQEARSAAKYLTVRPALFIGQRRR